jgi:diguanylate cyclase (GGDEF)-like protein
LNAVAFSLWCGRDGRQQLLLAIAGVMTAGYALGFSSYEFRVGWANGLLALELALIARDLAQRPKTPVGRWRWLLAASIVAQAGITAGRGVLGAFFSDAFPRFNTPHPVNITFALVAIVSNVLSMVGILLAHREEAARELERLASVDGLTGVFNRRAWLARANAELARSLEADEPLALVMIDLDHFKSINDTLGHEAGDEALRFMAQALRGAARATDLVGRYGGEEFCVLMKGAHQAGAIAFDRRLREVLREGSAKALGFPIGYSAGVAMRATPADSMPAMLQRADEMLYRAKSAGRGRTLGEAGPHLQVVA